MRFFPFTLPQSLHMKVSLLLQRQIARTSGKTTAQECRKCTSSCCSSLKNALCCFFRLKYEKGKKCPSANHYPLLALKSALGVSLSIYFSIIIILSKLKVLRIHLFCLTLGVKHGMEI